MPHFRYKARNERGEAMNGELEAGSADALATQLLNSGLTPIEIREFTPRRDIVGEIQRKLGMGRPSLDDLVLFCRQMHTLVKSGVPIIRGLTSLSETTRNPILSATLASMVDELEAGRELSIAMGHHPELFSQLMVSMVRVGENTGRLDDAFLQLSRYLELDRDTRNRVREALRYPLFVLLAIGAAITVINIKVIPAFASVFAQMGSDLPWQTRLLMTTSDFFVAWWPAMLATLIAGSVATRYYLRSELGRYRWDRLRLRLPLAGDIISRATLGRFARSFAMTIRAGVPLIHALTVISRAVDNSYVGERILSMRNGIERGDTLTRTATATSLFTPLVLQMLAVGEETGAVDQMMEEVAEFYEREVEYDLKALSARIEPIMLVAIGILVLILAFAVFLPLWSLYDVAK